MSAINIKKSGTGFILEYGDTILALDVGIPGETTLLSHSHFDHIGGLRKASHIVATTETFDTIAARGLSPSCSRTLIKYDETFGQMDVNITAFNAGHVLGSCMFLLEFHDGLSVLYTGDFNSVDSIVHTAASPVPADVLITEATYGTPRWIFPDRPVTHNQIVQLAQDELAKGKIPIFRAYSVGKAQEVIALLQHEGIPVVSGNKVISRVCKVYNKYGSDLNALPMNKSNLSRAYDESCAIVSSNPQATYRTVKRITRTSWLRQKSSTYSLTGWSLGSSDGRGLPLSAHADFPGLIGFAQKVNPRIVYCFTSNARALSTHLSEMGLTAVPLE